MQQKYCQKRNWAQGPFLALLTCFLNSKKNYFFKTEIFSRVSTLKNFLDTIQVRYIVDASHAFSTTSEKPRSEFFFDYLNAIKSYRFFSVRSTLLLALQNFELFQKSCVQRNRMKRLHVFWVYKRKCTYMRSFPVVLRRQAPQKQLLNPPHPLHILGVFQL